MQRCRIFPRLHSKHTYRALTIFLLFLISINLVPLPIPIPTSTTSKAWWNSSWKYYRVCNIDTNGYLGYYQMKINVSYSSGGDVSCNGHCQSDFDDIRFVDIDNSTVLPSWRETYVSSQYAIFWVNISADAMSDGKILMYYGNSLAEDISNGDEVFDYFDDFEDTDFSNWKSMGVSTTVSQATADGRTCMKVDRGTTDGGNGWRYVEHTTSTQYILECLVYDDDTTHNPAGDVAFGVDTSNTRSYIAGLESWSGGFSAYNKAVITKVYSTSSYSFVSAEDVSISKNTWHRYIIKVNEDNITFEVYDMDDNLLYSKSVTDSEYAKDKYVGMRQWRTHTYYDNFIVRKYADPEPTWSSFGSEQSQENTPPDVFNPYPSDGATDVELQPICHIDVSDSEGDIMNISWYENTTGTWVLQQTNSSVSNGTYYWHFTNASQYSTTYYWKVEVDDGNHTTTKIYHFTTKKTVGEGWQWVRQLNISNATADYQIKLRLYENDPSKDDPANGTIDLAGHCENFPNDIRFGTTDDPSTAVMLPQWIENEVLGWNEISTSPDTDCAQGYARNANYHFLTHTNLLKKYDTSWNLVASNSDPVGDTESYFNDGKGRNHIGDIDYYNGYIYGVVEEWTGDCSDYPADHGQAIAKFDPSDLSFISAVSLTQNDSPLMEAAGIHIENDIAYIVSWCDGSKIFKFDLDGNYLGYISLSQTLSGLQGITGDGTYFYLSSGPIGSTQYIYKVKKDGTVLETIYENTHEGFEGLDYYNGTIGLLHNVDRGSGTDEIVRFLENQEYVDVWIKLPSPAQDHIYLFIGNENASRYSSGDDTFLFFDDFSHLSAYNSSKWDKIGSGDVEKVITEQFTASHGGQGLATDGTYFYWGHNNGAGVNGTIYKIDMNGNEIDSFDGPEHTAGLDWWETHNTLLAISYSSSGSLQRIWEINASTGEKIQEWNLDGVDYGRGGHIAWKEGDTVYFLSSDSSWNFKIREVTLHDDGTYTLGDVWSHSSLGTPQGLDYVDGYLYYLYDTGISKLQLNDDGTITVLETLSSFPDGTTEKEGLTYLNGCFYYGNGNLEIYKIENQVSIDISSASTSIYSKEQFGTWTAIRCKWRATSTSLHYPGFGYGNKGSPAPDIVDDSYNAHGITIANIHTGESFIRGRQSDDGTNRPETDDLGVDQSEFHIYEIRRKSSSSEFVVDDGSPVSLTSHYPTEDLYIGIGGHTHSESGQSIADWILVRKYADPEPAFSSFGSWTSLGGNVPSLTNPSVTPSSGVADYTIFYFNITYSDADGDPPVEIRVNISKTGWYLNASMSYISGDNTTGALYSYSTTLPAGTYDYLFYANDGTYSTVNNPTDQVTVEAQSYSFTVSTADPSGQENFTASATMGAEWNVDASYQTSSIPAIQITNTGNVPIDISISLTSAPIGNVHIKYNTSPTPPSFTQNPYYCDKELTTTPVTVFTIGVGETGDIWLWADFENKTNPGSYTTELYISSTFGG